jgi:hypothetical protein
VAVGVAPSPAGSPAGPARAAGIRVRRAASNTLFQVQVAFFKLYNKTPVPVGTKNLGHAQLPSDSVTVKTRHDDRERERLRSEFQTAGSRVSRAIRGGAQSPLTTPSAADASAVIFLTHDATTVADPGPGPDGLSEPRWGQNLN